MQMKYRNLLSVFSIVVFAFVLGFFLSHLIGITTGNAAQQYTVDFIEITVENGGTLWSIAKQVVPVEDPRKVIWVIQSENQLQTANIIPGQVLKVPVYQATL